MLIGQLSPIVMLRQLIYHWNKFFCFIGVIFKFTLILVFKISIERGNDIENEIQRHYHWNNKHAQAVSCHGKASEEDDIAEIVYMHR